MNEPTSGSPPGGSDDSHGHRPQPAAPHHERARRPLAAPGGSPHPRPPVPHPYDQGGHQAAPAPAAPDPDPHRQPYDDGPLPRDLRFEPTGHPPVDDRLERLDDAHHLPVSAHLEVYEDVHRGLRDTLTALDRHDPRS